MGGHFQVKKAAEELKAYFQSSCEGSGAGIANSGTREVELSDGGVFLLKIEQN